MYNLASCSSCVSLRFFKQGSSLTDIYPPHHYGRNRQLHLTAPNISLFNQETDLQTTWTTTPSLLDRPSEAASEPAGLIRNKHAVQDSRGAQYPKRKPGNSQPDISSTTSNQGPKQKANLSQFQGPARHAIVKAKKDFSDNCLSLGLLFPTDASIHRQQFGELADEALMRGSQLAECIFSLSFIVQIMF